MDEVETAGYVVPCAVCSAVNWAISADLKYYCKSCHNVIDKTAEVADHTFLDYANRITDLSSFRQRRVVEYGRKWKVCEGFQFILKHQAEALILLGVHSQFKDDVLCQLWRLYLQKSRQAYTKNPLSSKVPPGARDTDTDPSDNDTGASSAASTGAPSATPPGASSATPPGAPSATPPGASSANPTGASSTTPTGASSTTPTGASSTTPTGASSTTPTGASSTTPTGASSTTPTGASSTTPTGASSATATGASSANEKEGESSANEKEGKPSANETEGQSANEMEGSPGGLSAFETDGGPSASDTEGRPSAISSTSGASSDEDRPKRHKVYPSGSEDSGTYLSLRLRRANGLMSMNKTLALLYLGLLWCREALTLADLLRLVREGHLPFINAFECLPEEMKLFGRDLPVFRVQSIPSYRTVHQEACGLAVYMKLPSFPPVDLKCLQHPTLLTMRYLLLLNLPDQLHPWVCRVITLVGLDQGSALTFDPTARSRLPYYDVQAAALIVVTLKMVFGVDDRSEWDLSNGASAKNKDDPDQRNFSMRRWYRLLHAALIRARRREEDRTARMQWTAQKPIYPSWERKASYIKKRRMVDQLRTAFTRLSGTPAEPRRRPPSSFRFRWGGEEGEAGWDGPSLSHTVLDTVVKRRRGGETAVNEAYWHPPLKKCHSWACRRHFEEDRATLPKMYCWLLELVSFLLGVKQALVHEEVLRAERLLLGRTQSSSKSRGGEEEEEEEERRRRRTTRRGGGTRKTGRANLSPDPGRGKPASPGSSRKRKA
ncbi:TATA box-binding protein-associated factor RNA polymerase I subunit B isoform X2 [Gadus macrocephalus]|uniref:TATA box-binding protein-associated factor RNA polymerase I subunit B isoform X2 n=1 Tax=Gadus macrocephalus TaxID=80720 RepID=UPI0028CB15C1|nr:TATA box-binding protein-associated factor RNA polymerase I subunit B isoform X2 [Gadus macrocephalus]